MEPVPKDLIKKLLVADKAKRLGSLKGGSEDVKRHRWFKGVDWDGDVYDKRLRPPIVPVVSGAGDYKNYDEYAEIDWRKVPRITDREEKFFDDF